MNNAPNAQLGIGFPGYTNDRYCSRTGWATLPAEIMVPGTDEIELPGVGRLRLYSFTRTERGVFAFTKVRPGTYLLAASKFDTEPIPDDIPMTFDELRESAREILGTPLPIQPPNEPDARTFRDRGSRSQPRHAGHPQRS